MKLSIFLFLAFLLTSCSFDSNLNGNLSDAFYNKDEILKKNETPRPFKANFFTIRNYSNSGEGYCDLDSDLPAFNYQFGEKSGTATHMGLITAEVRFCGAAGPGPDGIPYGNGIGKLVAANGDEVHFEVPPFGELGYVVLLPPGTHPVYDAYFETPFVITGGTGRFENATGSGTTYSQVDLFNEDGFIPEHQTDHSWKGTITF